MSKIEIWKPVKGYELLYSVSNLGKVKSLHYNHGNKEKILVGRINRGGYRTFLFNNNYKRKYITEHRLVAQAFLPNPNNYPQINHKDGNKLNNNVCNLEWCSAKQNSIHAYKNGLSKGNPGEGNSQSKLTEQDIRKIRQLGESKEMSFVKIGKLFKIGGPTAFKIIKRKSWRHIK